MIVIFEDNIDGIILNSENIKISIIGLGYVGLPLYLAFSKFYDVIGFDINSRRIKELKNFSDHNKQVTEYDFKKLKNVKFTDNKADIADSNIYIITVPTPVDDNNEPFLDPLISASKLVGLLLKKGDIVIYESTVFPGATEEICVPNLELNSNLKYNKDFFCGYSPERINPGDKIHHLSNIVKITSGSTKKTADFVDSLYQSIVSAGTHKVSSIIVAEAAKVIENTQRDINIALINEFSKIFKLLKIDTDEVLQASGTKWNFLPFKPGLVGGHCIGVDPYYLMHKAKKLGYNASVILSGREINDSMSDYVVDLFFQEMNIKNIRIKESKILVLGVTFKENCPDIRNSKVDDIINKLIQQNVSLSVHDPLANSEEIKIYKSFFIEELPVSELFDGIILAVSHNYYKKIGVARIKSLLKENSVFFDVKSCFNASDSDIRL